MQGQFKGFYNVGNDFACNFESHYIPSMIAGVKDYGVIRLEQHPAYGIVFDRAFTVYPQSDNTGEFVEPQSGELHAHDICDEHMAIILVAPRHDADKLYQAVFDLFSVPKIQELVNTDAENYDTAVYSLHQANLSNGQSILHFVSNSGIVEHWPILQQELDSRGAWQNIDYILQPDDLFNCYYNYFDKWFLKNTSVEFAKAFYDTFKDHPFFEGKASNILKGNLYKKLKL